MLATLTPRSGKRDSAAGPRPKPEEVTARKVQQPWTPSISKLAGKRPFSLVEERGIAVTAGDMNYTPCAAQYEMTVYYLEQKIFKYAALA